MSFLNAIFGSKPEIAAFVPTDLQEEQSKAIAGNAASVEALGALSDKIAKESGQATRTGIETVTPGALENIDKATQQIGSMVKGEVPQDVADEIARRTAELSVQRGVTPRSGIGNNFSARELGLTSLNLVQNGIGMAQQWMQQAQGGFQTLNFGSMFVDPAQQAAFTVDQREAQRSITQAKYNVDAAPNPVAAGLTSLAVQAAGTILGGPAGGAIAKTISSKIFGNQSKIASDGGYSSAVSAVRKNAGVTMGPMEIVG